MPELNQYVHRDKKFTVGTRVIIMSEEGHGEDIGMQGEQGTIRSIRKDGGNGIQIGIEFDRHTGRRHDLEGRCELGHGWWLTSAEAINCLNLEPEIMSIEKNIEYRGKNLKGMKCRALSYLKDGSIFVELEEDIGGMSCDGLGKKGHCIVVKPSAVGMKPIERSDTNARRSKKEVDAFKTTTEVKKKIKKKKSKTRSIWEIGSGDEAPFEVPDEISDDETELSYEAEPEYNEDDF